MPDVARNTKLNIKTPYTTLSSYRGSQELLSSQLRLALQVEEHMSFGHPAQGGDTQNSVLIDHPKVICDRHVSVHHLCRVDAPILRLNEVRDPQRNSEVVLRARHLYIRPVLPAISSFF